jgi:hypothetical protein
VTGEFYCKQPNDRGELLESEDAKRSGRVMQAMLQMQKIDNPPLESKKMPGFDL